MLLPISDFSGRFDVTEYIVTIFLNLFKYYHVYKNANEKKIGGGGEGEERSEEILPYSHSRNVLCLLLTGSCLLGKQTSSWIMRADSKVTIARFNCSIVFGKS